MADDTTTPPPPPATGGAPEDGDVGGSWFKRNWKNMLAVFGLVGGVLAMMSGTGEMMLLGLVLLAVGAVALFAPETFGQVGDAVGGAWNRNLKRVSDKVRSFNLPGFEPELTAENLATPEGQKAQMSDSEKEFERWALSDDILAKLDQKDRENLSRILKKMREGKAGEQVKLDPQDITGFVEGLNDNSLPQAEKDTLRQAADKQLSVFR